MSSKRVKLLGSFGVIPLSGALILGAFSGIGCTESQRPPRIEDEARKMTPIPACIMRLPPRSTGRGFVRNLAWYQYWDMVFPATQFQPPNAPQSSGPPWGFEKRPKDAAAAAALQQEGKAPDEDQLDYLLHQGSLTCTGRDIFSDAVFKGGDSGKGWPRVIEDRDIMFGSGGDRLKILWMRTHRWADGSEAGPLALVRTHEDYAELYALGAFRGQPPHRDGDHPFFQLERMGTEPIVTAEDDGCVGADVTAPCENTLSLFLPRKGELVNAVTISLEQRAYGLNSEPGMYGRFEYRGTTTPKFMDGSIRLLDQVTVKDDAGRVVHKADRYRTLILKDNQLVGDLPPLFPALYPKITSR